MWEALNEDGLVGMGKGGGGAEKRGNSAKKDFYYFPTFQNILIAQKIKIGSIWTCENFDEHSIRYWIRDQNFR